MTEFEEEFCDGMQSRWDVSESVSELGDSVPFDPSFCSGPLSFVERFILYLKSLSV